MKKGFTIIESLVAIAILVIAIMGAMSAVQTGLSSYAFSKNQVIAFYLAQEGFEQVRNTRDENALKGRNWLYGIANSTDDPCYFNQACTVDTILGTLARCTGGIGSCPVLRQSPTAGFYGQNTSWTPTIFTREVTLKQINSDEIAVTVKVSWSRGIVTREFKARENLLNWQ